MLTVEEIEELLQKHIIKNAPFGVGGLEKAAQAIYEAQKENQS